MTGGLRGGDYRGGAVEGHTQSTVLAKSKSRDVQPKERLQMSPSIKVLPPEAEALIDYRFPDALDTEYVCHSELCYTVTVMDLDYVHYTFRLNKALDGHWTLAPIAGFEENTWWE